MATVSVQNRGNGLRQLQKKEYFLPLDEVIASRAVFVIVSGSDVLAGENASGAN